LNKVCKKAHKHLQHQISIIKISMKRVSTVSSFGDINVFF